MKSLYNFLPAALTCQSKSAGCMSGVMALFIAFLLSVQIVNAQTALNFEPIYTTGGSNYAAGNYNVGQPGQYNWSYSGAIPTDVANAFIKISFHGSIKRFVFCS